MQTKRRNRLFLVVALVGTGCLSSSGVQLGTRWRGTPAEAFFESGIAQDNNCIVCHTVGDRGGTVGPVLNNVGYRRSEQWLREWLRDPNQVKNGTLMPKFPFSPGELDQAVKFLSAMKLDMRTEAVLAGNGSPVEKGEELFASFDCTACHRIGDEGRTIGPNLTWVGSRKTQEWERNWLRDPPAFKPGTFMPNFHLSEPAIDALTAYLHTLTGAQNEKGRNWERRAGRFFGYSTSQRGELVFSRLACAACHGERLREGLVNPNAKPDGRIPAINTRVGEMTIAELRKLVDEGLEAEKLDPSGPDPLYDCPAYPGGMDDEDASNLHAFLQTLAPEQREWVIREND